MPKDPGHSSQKNTAVRILAPVCGVMIVVIQMDHLGYQGLASAIGVLAGALVVGMILTRRTDTEQLARARGEYRKGVWPLLNEVVNNLTKASPLELVVVGCSMLFFLVAVSHLKIVWLSNLLLFAGIILVLLLVVVARSDTDKLLELKRMQGRDDLFQYMVDNVSTWTAETRAIVGASALLILYGLFQV